MAGNDVDIVIGAHDKATSVLNSVADKFSKMIFVFDPISASLNLISGAASAAGEALSAIAGHVSAAAESIDALVDQSRGLGVSVGDLRVFQHALGEVGNVDAEKTIGALQKLRKAIGEIASGGNASGAAVFEKMGLDIKELQRQNPIDQFMQIKDALGSIGNLSEKAAVAQTLFGKSAADLLPALMTGKGEIEASMRSAELLGIAFDDAGSGGVAEMNDAIARVGLVIEGIAGQLAIEIAPIIKTIIGDTDKWGSTLSGAGAFIHVIATEIAFVAGELLDAVDAASKLARSDFLGAGMAATRAVTFASGKEFMGNVDAEKKRAEESSRILKKQREEQNAAIGLLDDGSSEREQKRIDSEEQARLRSLERIAEKEEREAERKHEKELDRIRRVDEEMERRAVKRGEDIARDAIEQDKRKLEEQDRLNQANPANQAFEGRLLTRGPNQDKIDKVAVNTEATVALLEKIPEQITTGITDALKSLGSLGVMLVQ